MKKIFSIQTAFKDNYLMESLPVGISENIAKDILNAVEANKYASPSDIEAGDSAADKIYIKYIESAKEDDEKPKKLSRAEEILLATEILTVTEKESKQETENDTNLLSKAECSLVGEGIKITKESRAKHQKEMKEKHGHKYSTEKDVEAVEMDCEISDDGIKNIDILLNKGNQGDKGDAYKIVVYQNAYILKGMNSGCEVIPKEELGEYLDMIRLLAPMGTLESKRIIEQLTAKLPKENEQTGELFEPLYVTDTKGKRFLNIEALGSLYIYADVGMRNLKEMRKKFVEAAESYIKNEELQFKSGEEFVQENIIEGEYKKLCNMVNILDDYARIKPRDTETQTKMAHIIEDIKRFSYKCPDAIMRVSLRQEELAQNELNGKEPMLPEVRNLVFEYAQQSMISAKQNPDYIYDSYAQEAEEQMVWLKLQNDIRNQIATPEEYIKAIAESDIGIARRVLDSILKQQNGTHNSNPNPATARIIFLLSKQTQAKTQQQVIDVNPQFGVGIDSVQEKIIAEQVGKINNMCNILDDYVRRPCGDTTKIARSHLMEDIKRVSDMCPDAIVRASLMQEQLAETELDGQVSSQLMLPEIRTLMFEYAQQSMISAKQNPDYNYDSYAQAAEEQMVLLKLQNDIRNQIATPEEYIKAIAESNTDIAKRALDTILQQQNADSRTNPARQMIIRFLGEQIQEQGSKDTKIDWTQVKIVVGDFLGQRQIFRSEQSDPNEEPGGR